MAGALLEVKLEGGAGSELTTEQHTKIAENFKLLDKDKDDKLTQQEAAILFRALGQNPTDEELNDMQKSEKYPQDLESFCNFFTSNYKPPTTVETLIRAFQVFDLDDTGKMNSEKFKDMLSSLGEPMPLEDVETILKEVEVEEDGRFDYRDLAKRLCEGPKRIPGIPD